MISGGFQRPSRNRRRFALPINAADPSMRGLLAMAESFIISRIIAVFDSAVCRARARQWLAYPLR